MIMQGTECIIMCGFLHCCGATPHLVTDCKFLRSEDLDLVLYEYGKL